MSVTIKDIAKIIGVSHSTVSRGLNNNPLVAEKTKIKIKQVANELGFVFNANARSLSTNSTNTIGVIYPENYNKFGVNLYYGSLLNELRYNFEKAGIDIIVSFPCNRFTKDNNIKRLILTRKVDGLIIVYPNIEDIGVDILNFLESSKVPHVFLHHHSNFTELTKSNIFYTDHFIGGYLATEYLIKIGHRNILSLTCDDNSEEFNERTRGYIAALNTYNIPIHNEYILYGSRTINFGYDTIKENLKLIKNDKITAIFAQTDLMALGCMEAFKELKITVPDEMSIVGYDDIELIMNFKPNLTTMHQPREELAILACERLIQLLNSIDTNKVVNIKIKPKLMIRDSTKPFEDTTLMKANLPVTTK